MCGPPLIEISDNLTAGAAVIDDNGSKTLYIAPGIRLTPDVVDLINDVHLHRIGYALSYQQGESPAGGRRAEGEGGGRAE